jgi:superfamily II DNA helicase RecQ
MEEITKNSKLSAELKQTTKGIWYVGSVKVNAESTDELSKLLSVSTVEIGRKVNELNSPKKEVTKKEEIVLSETEKKVFENFRKLRSVLAEREGFPPYVIFHDSTLKKLIKEKPVEKEKVKEIIGEKKFNKYGDLVMELLGKQS